MDDDIIRIMVSTDNHLGYAERDPVRCHDSFAPFEEMLWTSKKKQVDFVILAGDLFHENKPSRKTLHTAMELFRKYSLGEEPVYIEILNDQKEIFKYNHGEVNFQDPYLSVSLPIFAIHGNHDDPSREGGQGESLSALDLLSINNNINYFGKAENLDSIEIIPILIKKNNTFIALYGLGAIRDERLNRLWNKKNLKFVRPSIDQDRDKFFNIFVLHQNRDYGRGKKNCVHESMIPEWIDLVIWGNEHECKPNLAESLVGTFRILQPGSSVPTSFSETESSLFPKHMGIIEVRSDKKFRMIPILYNEIRPFLYKDLSLSNVKGLEAHDLKIEEKIKDYLTVKITEIIDESDELIRKYQENYNDNIKYHIKEPKLVLIRLRVDPVGLPTINQQRFGSQFVGRVANPGELLLFARKKKEIIHTNANKINSKEIEEIDNDEPIDSIGAVHKIKVEELVMQALESNQRNLNILPETELGLALEDYVKRKHANAFTDAVNDSLEQTQAVMVKSAVPPVKESILESSRQTKEKSDESLKRNVDARHKSRNDIVYSDDDNNAEDDDDKPIKPVIKAKRATKKSDDSEPVKKGRKPAEKKTTNTKATTQRNNTSKSDSTPVKRGTTGRSAAVKKKTYAEEDSEVDDIIDDDEDDDDVIVFESTSKKSHAHAKFNIDDDDDIMDVDDNYITKPSKPKASQKTNAVTKVPETKKVTSKFVTDDDRYIDECDLTGTVAPSNQPKAFDISKLTTQNNISSNTSKATKRKLPGSFSQSESFSGVKKSLTLKNTTSWDD